MGSRFAGCLVAALAGWLWADAAGIAAAAPEAGDAADELFAGPAVRRLRLEIAEAGLAVLRGYVWRKGEPPEARPSVACTVRENGAVFTNVSVHLKGGYGSFRPVDAKPGLTLNFSKLAKGQQFHGLTKLSLNNSVQDPTYLTDKLCRELFLRAGVPVPRADYATAELNGRPLGLFVLTEGWDRRFLRRHFRNVTGNLYDPPVGADIHKTLPVVCGDHPDDQAELAAAVRAAKEPDPARRLAALEQVVDLDRFLTFIALDILLWDWDGYAIGRNNYRVFHDLEAGRIVFMPHGLDQMFWRPEGPILTGRGGLVSRALVGTREGRRRYLERAAHLRATVLNLPAMLRRVDELAARIRPVLQREGPAVAARHDASVASLRARIVQRLRSIDEQLAGAKRLFCLEPGQSVPLTGWEPRVVFGQPTLDRTTDPEGLHLRVERPGAGAWRTLVWLEEGSYRVEARVKTRVVLGEPTQPLAGAGLRVWSARKETEGPSWGWFPYHASTNRLRRGELVASNFIPRRLTGTAHWTALTHEFELRQPIADLDVLCELYALRGEAWFDPKSLRLTRTK